MQNDPMIEQFIAWGQAHDSIRAVVLTSTRTRPDAQLDAFSDYDVILAVDAVAPWFEDRGWLGNFGDVLVVYRDPIRQVHGFERFAYITQYTHDHLKIDFTVMDAGLLAHLAGQSPLPPDLDVGYHVLLDKDGLTDGIQPPTYTAFIPQKPSETDYLETIEVFFHEATYVHKNIWRDELLPAKYSFDQVMKQQLLRRMLEWYVGVQTGWTVPVGALGKGLTRHIPAEWWEMLEQSYVGTGAAENLVALILLLDQIGRASCRERV